MTVQGRRKVQREPRRQMNGRPAWITIDETESECSVLDVSPGGAKIMTDIEVDIHDRFVLALVPNHSRSQQCEVVWRRGNTLGVRFVT